MVLSDYTYTIFNLLNLILYSILYYIQYYIQSSTYTIFNTYTILRLYLYLYYIQSGSTFRLSKNICGKPQQLWVWLSIPDHNSISLCKKSKKLIDCFQRYWWLKLPAVWLDNTATSPITRYFTYQIENKTFAFLSKLITPSFWAIFNLAIYFSPAGIYLLKVNNRNTRTKVWNMFKVNNKDTKTTPMESFWCLNC